MIKKLVKKINASSFQKSVAILFGGTVFAQAVGMLSLPILTRLYSPEDFGLLAVYAAILGILLTVTCMRFEIAIPLPAQNTEAISLLILSLIFTIVFSTITLIAVTVAPNHIVELVSRPDLLEYLWLFPVGVLLGGSYNALQYWATRQKQFPLIAKTRLFQAVSGASIQIGIGWGWAASIGLIIGYIFNVGAGGFALAKSILKENFQIIKEVRLDDLKRVFLKYQSFPKYSSVEALANTAGIQLPIIMIAATLSAHQAGFLILALRVMQAPMSFIGSAIAQVYLSQAAASHKENTLSQLTINVLSSLLKFGIGPLIFVGIIGSELFGIIFGAEWAYAGVLIAWMTPWFVFQFISSPISMVMHVTGKQKGMLLLTVIGFIIRVGGVSVAILYAHDLVAEVYAISGGIFYLVCFFVFSNAANVTKEAIVTLLLKHMPIVIGWVGLGVVLKLILGAV